tara:strand:+ start:1616 stop:2365 length:750 start_codon:yes stop_codon:yes gene_type:complete
MEVKEKTNEVFKKLNNTVEESDKTTIIITVVVLIISALTVIGLSIYYNYFYEDEDSDEEDDLVPVNTNNPTIECEKNTDCTSEENIQKYLLENNISEEDSLCILTGTGECKDNICEYDSKDDGFSCSTDKVCKDGICANLCDEKSQIIKSNLRLRKSDSWNEDLYDTINDKYERDLSKLTGKLNRKVITTCSQAFPSDYDTIKEGWGDIFNQWSWEPCNAYYSIDGYLCNKDPSNNKECINGLKCHLPS